MINTNCKHCGEDLSLFLQAGKALKHCPNCGSPLTAATPAMVDSFDSAVRKVLEDYTVNVLSDRQKFLAYLSDVGSNYRREIKILTNACDSKTLINLKNLSLVPIAELSAKVSEIEKHIMEDEGISELWAARICNSIITALRRDYIPRQTKSTQSPAANPSQITDPEKLKWRVETVKNIYQKEIYPFVPQNDFVSWFNGLSRAKELLIPNGVTSVREKQFASLTSLNFIIVGNGMKDVPRWAFDSTRPYYVYLSEGVEKISDHAFSNSWRARVIVPYREKLSISKTAFDTCYTTDPVTLVFDHEQMPWLVSYCKATKVCHEDYNFKDMYFQEYAKIRLK